MVILRVMQIMIWSVVFLYMAPSVWALLRGKGHKGDPARTVSFGFSVVMLILLTRWFYAPDNDHIWMFAYFLNFLLAFYTLHVSRVYGRGRPL